MIPLQNTIRARCAPLMNWALIIANVIMLVYVQRMPLAEPETYLLTHGAVPARLLSGMGAPQLWTLFPSMFLHAGWIHMVSVLWAHRIHELGRTDDSISQDNPMGRRRRSRAIEWRTVIWYSRGAYQST